MERGKICVDVFFTDYRIISHPNNEITLNPPTNALSAVLRSVSLEHTSTNEVVMKLAKRNDIPVLSLEIFGTTQMDRRAHNVRIEAMKLTDATLLTEPQCPEPDVVRRRFIMRKKGLHPPDCSGPDHAPTAHQDLHHR